MECEIFDFSFFNYEYYVFLPFFNTLNEICFKTKIRIGFFIEVLSFYSKIQHS
jgi:hypothetical protein